MVTRFWWVRHGPTHEATFAGWRNVPADLSDIAALTRLNVTLPSEAMLISSDLSRAITTADTLEGRGRRRLPHDANLREFNFGAWEGLRFDAVATRNPELSRAFWEQPGSISAPDGESWNAVTDRVEHAVGKLRQAYPDGDIIAVTHIGVIMSQIGQASPGGAMDALGYKIDTLSITQIEIGPDSRRIVAINHCP